MYFNLFISHVEVFLFSLYQESFYFYFNSFETVSVYSGCEIFVDCVCDKSYLTLCLPFLFLTGIFYKQKFLILIQSNFNNHFIYDQYYWCSVIEVSPLPVLLTIVLYIILQKFVSGVFLGKVLNFVCWLTFTLISNQPAIDFVQDVRWWCFIFFPSKHPIDQTSFLKQTKIHTFHTALYFVYLSILAPIQDYLNQYA